MILSNIGILISIIVMAKFIVFGNQKGGIGKTTLTVLTATALSQLPFNKKVLLIDNDNQKSVVRLRQYDEDNYEEKPSFTIIDMTYEELVNAIEDIDENYDYVFIDTPGKLDADLMPEQQEVIKILLLTDYLFLPFKAGALNLDATTDYVKVLLQAQKHREQTNRPLLTYGVVNFHKERSRINRELEDELKYLKDHAGLEFMKASLKQYTAFEYLDTYKSFYSSDSNEPAKINFSAFIHEFYRLTNG